MAPGLQDLTAKLHWCQTRAYVPYRASIVRLLYVFASVISPCNKSLPCRGLQKECWVQSNWLRSLSRGQRWHYLRSPAGWHSRKQTVLSSEQESLFQGPLPESLLLAPKHTNKQTSLHNQMYRNPHRSPRKNHECLGRVGGILMRGKWLCKYSHCACISHAGLLIVKGSWCSDFVDDEIYRIHYFKPRAVKKARWKLRSWIVCTKFSGACCMATLATYNWRDFN